MHKSTEQAFLEMTQVYTTHWVFRYRIVIYDSITKVKVTEYGLFTETDIAEQFAREHHIKLIRK